MTIKNAINEIVKIGARVERLATKPFVCTRITEWRSLSKKNEDDI